MGSAREIELPGKHARWEWRDTAWCLALFALGLITRIWNLSAQSVWYDEWITLRALNEPSLAACIRKEIELDFSMVPAYHIAQYYWAHWVSGSDLGIRWLSLLFALAALPLLYVVARRLYGRGAAVLAVLVLALAPYHLFHAQGIRNYSLALLAGLLSMYCYLRCLEPEARRRWWLFNTAANALLLWTHLFGVFLFAVQGLHLLLFRWRERPVWVRWIAIHGLLLLPVALWQWSLPGNAEYPDVARPTLYRLYALLAHHYTHPFDWVDYSIPVRNAYNVLSPLGAYLGERNPENGFISRRMYSANLLHWLSFLLLAYYVVSSVFRARGGAGIERSRLLLTVLWAVVPAAGIFAIAWVFKKEAAFERYLIYAYPAMYVALGAAVMRLPWRPLRWGAALALAGLLCVQAVAYQVIPIRHDFIAAVEAFRREAAATSRVIAYQYTAENLFRYNLSDEGREIVRADSYEQLEQQLADELAQRGEAWVVLVCKPAVEYAAPEEHGLGERVLATCTARGWLASPRVFGGMQLVWLLHVRPADGGAPPAIP